MIILVFEDSKYFVDNLKKAIPEQFKLFFHGVP